MDAARRAKLGEKWVCFSCSARFYDLGKSEPVCPKCGNDQRDSPAAAAPKRRRSRKPRTNGAEVPAAVAPTIDPDIRQKSGLEVEDVESDLDALDVADEADEEIGLLPDEDFEVEEAVR